MRKNLISQNMKLISYGINLKEIKNSSLEKKDHKI